MLLATAVKRMFVLCMLALLATQQATSFRVCAPIRSVRGTRALSSLEMKYKPEDEGYDAFGSLVRQGPVPFFIRTFKPETYEAAVDKYMKLEGCSRNEAQGNMDFYFSDPNGWAGRKLRVKRGEVPDLDYSKMNTSPVGLILTAIWAVGIIGLFVRIFQVQVLHQ